MRGQNAVSANLLPREGIFVTTFCRRSTFRFDLERGAKFRENFNEKIRRARFSETIFV